MRTVSNFGLAALLAALLLSGCFTTPAAPTPEATEAPPTPAATATATATATVPPDTPTPPPTPTPTPTPTATPQPTPTLTPLEAAEAERLAIIERQCRKDPQCIEGLLNSPARLIGLETIGVLPPLPTLTPEPAPTRPVPPATPSFAEVVRRARPAVVKISTPSASGSGTLFTPQGHILTNEHVVRGHATVSVLIHDRFSRSGRVLHASPSLDLAVVKVPDEGWHFLEPTPRTPRVGDELLILGYPLDLPGEATLTRGLVSAHRTLEGLSLVQTDAGIFPGNSGGAALNAQGQFIGVPNAVLREEGAVGFVIDLAAVISRVRRLLG